MHFSTTFTTFILLSLSTTLTQAAPFVNSDGNILDTVNQLAEKHASLHADTHLLSPYITTSYLSTRSPNVAFNNNLDYEDEDEDDKQAGKLGDRILKKVKSIGMFNKNKRPASPPPKVPTLPPLPRPASAPQLGPAHNSKKEKTLLTFLANGDTQHFKSIGLRPHKSTGDIKGRATLNAPPVPALPHPAGTHNMGKRWMDDEDDEEEEEKRAVVEGLLSLMETRAVVDAWDEVLRRAIWE